MKETVGFSFFFENNLKFHLFIFACAESLLLLGLFSSCGKWGLHSHCGVWASLVVQQGL